MDKYLNVELIMNTGTNDKRFGHVLKRAWGLDSKLIGRVHANQLFDTREYKIELERSTR
jgi:HD-like signal output (HDOD) protein